MSIQEIPFQAAQPQTFVAALPTTFYRLTATWCDPAQCWVLDVANPDGTSIAAGLAIVTGRDLLEALTYLGVAGKMFVSTDHDPAAVPTFENLGQQGHLYLVTP